MSNSDPKEWKDSLAKALDDTDKNDLIIPYGQVAKAFPSLNAHQSTFDHSIIDDVALRNWGSDRGWQIDLAPEVLPEDSSALPPVRFRKNVS